MANKRSPNAPCPCGSGRKFKKCHGPTIKADTHLTQEIEAGRHAGPNISRHHPDYGLHRENHLIRKDHRERGEEPPTKEELLERDRPPEPEPEPPVEPERQEQAPLGKRALTSAAAAVIACSTGSRASSSGPWMVRFASGMLLP